VLRPLPWGVALDAVHDLVVQLQHRALELGDDEVLVVARVPDDRDPRARRPRQVGAREPLVGRDRIAEHEVQAVVLVEERLVRGAAPVDVVQVEAWRAVVGECVGVGLAGQARHRVERDVVVDELPEVRVARGQAELAVVERGGVLVVVDLAERLVDLPALELLDHGLAELGEVLGALGPDGDVTEHAAEPSARRRRRGRGREAAQRGAVRAGCGRGRGQGLP